MFTATARSVDGTLLHRVDVNGRHQLTTDELAGSMTLIAAGLAVGVSEWFLLLAVLVGVNQWLYALAGWCPASLILRRMTRWQ